MAPEPQIHLLGYWGKIVAFGSSSHIYSVDCIIKSPTDDDVPAEHLIECAIYKRLKHHPRIVQAYIVAQGESNVIILERMDMSLKVFLAKLTEPLPDATILDIAQQLLEGFRYLHDKRVIQSDVGAHNVLINPAVPLVKLCDFAGSSLDGSEALVFSSNRLRHPLAYSQSTFKIEHFAIGSLLYELSTNHEPYHDLMGMEAQAKYRRQEYPDVHCLVLASVIKKCWTEQYDDTQQIVEDIKYLRDQHASRMRLIYVGLMVTTAALLMWRRRS